MEPGKLLEKDKDEWFYRSLKKYKNLYMFELEFPVDAIQVIQATSICIAGTQNFSKRCEVLQLSIPLKLLPKDIEEGLCKDRDFKIDSGGYAQNKIIQIKSLSKEFIATVQQGKSGVTIFKLGGDESALLKEVETLTPPPEDLIFPSLSGVIDTGSSDSKSGQIAQAISDTIYIWDTNCGRYKSSIKYTLLPEDIQGEQKITKIKFWDESQNTLVTTTSSGQVLLYDTRDKKINYSHRPSKTFKEGLNYSFDSISSINKVYLIDSCGGIESFDIRATAGESNRVVLSEFDNVQHVFEGKLNIEIDPHATNSNVKFIVSGFKDEFVHVFKESSDGITSCFTHDGHTKPVTHSIWHQESDNLIFSTDIDSILHAWQFEDHSSNHNFFNVKKLFNQNQKINSKI